MFFTRGTSLPTSQPSSKFQPGSNLQVLPFLLHPVTLVPSLSAQACVHNMNSGLSTDTFSDNVSELYEKKSRTKRTGKLSTQILPLRSLSHLRPAPTSVVLLNPNAAIIDNARASQRFLKIGSANTSTMSKLHCHQEEVGKNLIPYDFPALRSHIHGLRFPMTFRESLGIAYEIAL